jgi:hypothetical protein
MFTKTAIALAIIVSTASGVLAATKTPSLNDVYNNRGERIGSDPDPNVRFMLRHDQGKD